jgi:raffinose/stachyose/melibiose transport system permease protein
MGTAHVPSAAAVREVDGRASAAAAGVRTSPRRRNQKVAYLYLLPALLVYSLFLLVPLGHAVWISLYDWDGLSPAKWVGLANYGETVSNPELRSAFIHSFVLIGFYAAVPVAVGLTLAGIMVRAARIRFLSTFRVILFLPQVVASVVVASMWSMLYDPSGLVNSVLRAIGLGGLATDWLGNFSTALPAVGVIGTWTQVGLCLVLFLAGIGQISPELYEAARLDGAGPVAEFFAVTLPGLRRQVVVALVLTVTAALRNFDVIFIATGGGPGTQTTVPAYEVYHNAFQTNRVGLASAIGVTLLAVIALLVAIVNRLDRRD